MPATSLFKAVGCSTESDVFLFSFPAVQAA